MVNANKAQHIWEKIQPRLKGQEGKLVAIEIDSGDYFVGNDTGEVYEKAHKQYPHKKFFLKRVGAKTAFRIGACQ